VTEPILTFQSASIAVGVKQIFSDLSWQVNQGDHVLITGQNGSGKTVLAKAIAGRLRITKGSLQLNHIDYQDIQLISFTDDGKLFHSVNNVHYYQQRFNSWDSDGFMTAKGYLLAKGVDVDNKENQDFLHLIGLKELLDLERIKLSSGQTRKLLLASALLKYPKLLIIDNPYIGLDKRSRTIFNEFLDQLVLKRKITLILTGQFTSLPKCIKKVITIQNGKLVDAARAKS